MKAKSWDCDIAPLVNDFGFMPKYTLEEAIFEKCELIINSTSIGLSGESFNVVSWPVLKKGCVVYDMVYSPKGTPLVRDAHAAGFKACYGLGMLAAQGEEAFRLWTGEYPNGVMRVALDSYLATL